MATYTIKLVNNAPPNKTSAIFQASPVGTSNGGVASVFPNAWATFENITDNRIPEVPTWAEPGSARNGLFLSPATPTPNVLFGQTSDNGSPGHGLTPSFDAPNNAPYKILPPMAFHLAYPLRQIDQGVDFAATWNGASAIDFTSKSPTIEGLIQAPAADD